MKQRKWAVGDRVLWTHTEGTGESLRALSEAGTVTARDAVTATVELDSPVNGTTALLATHSDLLPEE